MSPEDEARVVAMDAMSVQFRTLEAAVGRARLWVVPMTLAKCTAIALFVVVLLFGSARAIFAGSLVTSFFVGLDIGLRWYIAATLRRMRYWCERHRQALAELIERHPREFEEACKRHGVAKL